MHLQLRREVVQALGEQGLGLAHQPGLHRVADLLGRGGVGQGNIQGLAHFAVIAIVAIVATIFIRDCRHQLRTRRCKSVARVQHHPQRCPQERQHRAVVPGDTCGFHPFTTLTHFAKLAHNPVGFFAQCGVHVAQRCPAGCGDRQAVRPDREPDGAAFATAERIGHQAAAEQNFAGGLGMAEGGGSEGLLQRLGRQHGRCCPLHRGNGRNGGRVGNRRHRHRLALKQVQRKTQKALHQPCPTSHNKVFLCIKLASSA